MGIFIRHSYCPHCGSKDAYALYLEGSAFCWSCHVFDKVAYGGDGKGGYKKMAGELLTDLEIKAVQPRKILKKTCEAYGYAYGQHKGKPCQVAPYYHKGQLAAQHLRYPDKKFGWLGKAENLELFGQRIWPKGSNQRVVITEGEIDAMSVAQMFDLKVPVVSIPSGAGSAKKALTYNLEWITSFSQVILAMDNDEAGAKAVEDILPLFKPGQVFIFNYPEGVKDANEILQAGEGQKIVDCVYRARPYTPAGIISGKELHDDVFSEDKNGVLTPYPALNQKLYGFRKGELYLFTAGSGIGKSTLVHEIGYHFMLTHGMKLGIMALEESKKRLGRRYCGLYMNKMTYPVLDQSITREQMEEAFKRTCGSGLMWVYDHWGSTDLDGLLSKLRYMAVGCGVDWIILDHISIVVSGLDEVAESERKLIDRLMTRLRSLIEETGIGVMAIVHLKRVDDSKGTFNEGKAVRLTDLRGSGALEQLSDVVISLERNQQGENSDTSTVRILKNRPVGITGIADTLVYNHKTGRLLPEVAAAMQKANENYGF